MNLTILYFKNLQSPDAENWGYKKDRDILTFDWGSRLDLVAAKRKGHLPKVWMQETMFYKQSLWFPQDICVLVLCHHN